MRWYSYIFILGLWMVSGCSKECSWDYDVLHEKWIYECDPRAPEPIVYPTLVQGAYAVKNLKIEYIPSYKHASFYQELVEKYFKNYADTIYEISINKSVVNSNSAEVSGISRTSIQHADHTEASISFSGISRYKMPNNFQAGVCFEGLAITGNIDMRNGKPVSGRLDYKCMSEIIIRYSFDF